MLFLTGMMAMAPPNLVVLLTEAVNCCPLTSGASSMALEKSRTACSGRRCERCTLPILL